MNRKTDLLLRRSSTVCNWARQSDPAARRDCTKQTQHNTTRLQKAANLIPILMFSNLRIAIFAARASDCPAAASSLSAPPATPRSHFVEPYFGSG